MKKLTTMFTMLVLTTTLIAGCKKKKDEEGKEPVTAPVPAPKATDPVKTPDPKATDPAKTPDTAPTATGDLPKDCTDYKAAVDSATKCEKMKATSGALKTGLDTMAATWTNLSTPELRKTAGDGCKAATDTVTAALKAAGC